MCCKEFVEIVLYVDLNKIKNRLIILFIWQNRYIWVLMNWCMIDIYLNNVIVIVLIIIVYILLKLQYDFDKKIYVVQLLY